MASEQRPSSAPSPQTTVLILLGASQWPHDPAFRSEKAFEQAAQEVEQYFRETFGIPNENILPLFNTDDNAIEIGRKIQEHLEAFKRRARDVIVYYVGHAQQTVRHRQLCLLIKETHDSDREGTSLKVESLSRVVYRQARGMRRFYILDCGSSESALPDLQGVTGADLVELALEEEEKTSGYVALFSSGMPEAAFILPDHTNTFFTKALLHVLATGTPDAPRPLSFQVIREKIGPALRALSRQYSSRLRGHHSPEARIFPAGGIADVPIFPNTYSGKTHTEQPDPAAASSSFVQKEHSPLKRSHPSGIWHVGVPQLVAMAISPLLYGGLLGLLMVLMVTHPLWSADHAPRLLLFDLVHFGINEFGPLFALFLGCTFALPFFFGVEFGPWVGLICASVGQLTCYLVVAAYGYGLDIYMGNHYEWTVFPIWMFYGLIPGLASPLMHRQHPVWKKMLVAFLASVAAILFMTVLFYFHLTTPPAFLGFDGRPLLPRFYLPNITASYLSGLVLLVLLLLLYEAWLKKRFARAGVAAPDQGAASKGVARRKLVVRLGIGLAIIGGGALWYTLSQKARYASTRFIYRGHFGAVSALAWSPDGTRIASAGNEDTVVRVWDVTTGETAFVYKGHLGNSVNAVAWSPNGKWIASGSIDETVQVWDATTGQTLSTYRGRGGGVSAVTWSSNSERIASGYYDGTVHVWEAATGNTVYIYDGHKDQQVNTVAWSPNGKWIASGSIDETVQVWDATTHQTLYTYRGQGGVVSVVAWSPNSERIASAGGDDLAVRVWEAANGMPVCTYRGHTEPVNAVAWSPDRKQIASGDSFIDMFETTVQVWNAADGSGISTYRGNADGVYALAWSPKGGLIASAGGDSTVQVWQAP